MLNGAHSMLAYAGFIAGHRYVRDCMADPDLAALIRRHMSEAARTLGPVPGIDLGQYAERAARPVRQSGDRPRDLADRHGRHPETAAAADRAGNDRARTGPAAGHLRLRRRRLDALRARHARRTARNTPCAIRGRTRSPRWSKASALPAPSSTSCSGCPDFSPRNWQVPRSGEAQSRAGSKPCSQRTCARRSKRKRRKSGSSRPDMIATGTTPTNRRYRGSVHGGKPDRR